MKRRGAALIEVLLSVAILATVVAPLFVITISERSVSDYVNASVASQELAIMKMNEIEGKLRSNYDYYSTGIYYGYQYSPGSSQDMSDDPTQSGYTGSGTFWRIGFPEYRYQFFVTYASAGADPKAGKQVSLLVWRRPIRTGGIIVKEYLYEVIYNGLEN